MNRFILCAMMVLFLTACTTDQVEINPSGKVKITSSASSFFYSFDSHIAHVRSRIKKACDDKCLGDVGCPKPKKVKDNKKENNKTERTPKSSDDLSVPRLFFLSGVEAALSNTTTDEALARTKGALSLFPSNTYIWNGCCPGSKGCQ